MFNITINDKKIKVQKEATILEAAIEADIKIPTLCYNKELTPYGACRICLVEIVSGGRPGLQASCVYKVTEGLVVKTDTERVNRTRKIMFELLLARCPESERLRQMAQEYGVDKPRIKRKEIDGCILCGLCVRVCDEIVHRNAINFSGRGIKRHIETPFDKVSETCIGCNACAYLCPTGVIRIEEEK